MALAIDDFQSGLAAIAAARSPDELLDSLHQAVLALDGEGTSLGLLEGQEVVQIARGFSAAVAEHWARFPLQTDLPGPEVLRSGDPQFLAGRAVTVTRFPAAAAVVAGTDFGAGACIPLIEAQLVFGYVAVHYRGDHEFDAVERFLLTTLGAVAVGSAWRVGGAGRFVGHDDGGLVEEASLRTEVEQLRTALANRAPIEQAKGMLMQRYAMSADAAWRLLVRLSSASNIKVRDLAERCAAAQDLGAFVVSLEPARATLSDPGPER